MSLDEFKKFLPLFFLNFMLTSGFFLARTAKDAMFYSVVGAENLPWAFILNALVIFILGGWISRAQDRLPLKRMMVISWISTALFTLGFGLIFRIGVTTQLGHIPYFAFFAFFELPYLALTGMFWTFAESYFTERQADYIFPKITGGAHIGTAFAGFLAIFAIPFIGTSGLIFIWSGMLVIGLILILRMWKKEKPAYYSAPEQEESQESKGEGFASGLQAVLRHKYAVLFLLITFCTFFVMSVFDYSLADTSRSILGDDTEKLTVYLGWITAIFGIVAFFIQLFIVPKLVNRMGVANTNLIAPSLLTIAGGVLLTIYNFGAAAIARGLFLVNEFVFNQTLLPFIYGAVPERDRNQVRSTIEGTVTNVALAAAGIFLILPSVVKNFQSHWIGMVAFFAALAMLVLSGVLRKEYIAIRGTRYDAKDSTGRLRYLEALADLGDEGLDTQLRKDLISNSEPNIILALHFIRDHKRYKVFDAVLGLADDPSEPIRLAALETLSVIIRSDEDFDRFTNALRVPAPGREYLRFRKEDLKTLEAISKVYLKTGKSSQLGVDLEYILVNREYDPGMQGLAARYIIKSGAYAPITKGFKALETALDSEKISKKIMAADIIGELGYDENHFEMLKKWTEKDEDKSEMEKDKQRLRLTALEAIVKIGIGSRIAAGRSFDVAMGRINDTGLSRQALRGTSRIAAAHPILIQEIKSAWKSEEEEMKSFVQAMGGRLSKLPQLLLDISTMDAEMLLLEMIENAEHQTARQALAILCSRIHKQNTYLSNQGCKVCHRLSQNLLERLCLCERIRANLSTKLNRFELALDALSFRMEDLFYQYCQTIWLGWRTRENAERFDRDMTRIHSKDIKTRDPAIKSMEIIFEKNRDIYLELSNLIDALDPKKEEEHEKIFSQIIAGKNYDWQKENIKSMIPVLFESKKDAWLFWILEDIIDETKEEKSRVPSYFEQSLETLFNSEPFLGVPNELLAQLVLNSEDVEVKKGERLLYEGRSEQGIIIVEEGETSMVLGNQVLTSFQGAKVWGQFSAIAGNPSTFGVRATDSFVKGQKIRQETLEYWLSTTPQAAKIISRNIVKDIENLNEEEKKRKAEHEGIQEFTERLSKLQEEIHSVVSTTHKEKVKKSIQKRFLWGPINDEARESLKADENLDKKTLEQYYLIVEEENELRLRCENDIMYKMTLKDKKKGEVTIDVEKEIYEEMKQFAVGRVIRKDRYKFKSGAYKGWLIDIFDKESAFREMAIAEIELPDLKASMPDVPDYINIRKENDISELSDFENKNLSLYGPPDLMFFSKW
jgi:CRP-like cAMP-binding protein/MFS family permease